MFRIRCHGSRAYSEYARLTAQYGKLVRIGPNDVITSDPELIRRMSAAKSTYERSSWYKATRLDPYHDMMGSVLDKSAHHSLRTKLSPGYVGKDIPGLEASIDSGIAELVDLIRLKYTSRSKAANIPETGEKDQVSKPSDSESVDFGRLADYYAMDARSRMSFGRPIGLLQRDTDVFGLIRTSNIAIDVLQFFTDIPALQMIFTSDLVLRLLGPKPTDSSGFGKIMGLAQQHVVKRFAPDAKDEPDLLLFGEDAHIFRPQRWLEADAVTVKEWKKRTELVFGAGRWQCAGKAVAMIELNKMFVTLIRNFEFLPTSASMSVVIKVRKTEST
ncbi:hypothetical protein COL940_011674 [Colletotrichum noveboracense]|nr:hypothetical protein COL940_011674 [Colletotrichum noveboracense]